MGERQKKRLLRTSWATAISVCIANREKWINNLCVVRHHSLFSLHSHLYPFVSVIAYFPFPSCKSLMSSSSSSSSPSYSFSFSWWFCRLLKTLRCHLFVCMSTFIELPILATQKEVDEYGVLVNSWWLWRRQQQQQQYHHHQQQFTVSPDWQPPQYISPTPTPTPTSTSSSSSSPSPL